SHSARTSLGPDCGLFQPIWSANGQRIIYQELCVHPNGQSVNHLVVASPTHPLNQSEICDGVSPRGQDWGSNGQLLALGGRGGVELNELIVCELPGSLRP